MVGHVRVLAVALGMTLLAGCWPAPYQGPDRTGWNAFESAITVDTVDSLGEAWTARLSDRVIHVVSSGSSVFATSRRGFARSSLLFAVDPLDGSLEWSRSSPITDWTSPFVDGDEVFASYYLSGNVTLRLDAETGDTISARDGEVSSTRGRRSLIEQALPDATYTEGTLSFAVEHERDPDATWGGLVAVVTDLYDPTLVSELSLGRTRVYGAGYGLMSTVPGDGAQGYAVRAYVPDGGATCGPAERPEYACPVWVTPVDGPARAVPVLGHRERTVYVTTDAGTVYALDAANGAVRWSAAVGAVPETPPALAGGSLYVPTRAGGVAVLAADGCGAPTCSPLWQASTDGAPTGQPAVAGGVVYAGTASGAVEAFDASGCGAPTCAPLWSTELGAQVTAGPIVAGGRLLVGTDDGRLTAFRPATG